MNDKREAGSEASGYAYAGTSGRSTWRPSWRHHKPKNSNCLPDPTDEVKVIFTPEEYEDDEDFVEEDAFYKGMTVGICGTEKTKDFDYIHDLKVHRTEQINGMIQRLQEECLRRPGEDLESIMDVNSFIKDEDVHQSLRKRFGLLDVDSPKYKELFVNFKEELLEEFEAFFDKVRSVLEDSVASTPEEQIQEIAAMLKPFQPHGFMSPDDPRKKQNPNVFVSKTEPYKLPRPKVVDWYVNNSTESCKAENVLVHEGYMERKPETLNPAFCSFGMEYLRYCKFKGNVHFPLMTSILKVVRDYPFGISPNFLYNEFSRRNKYKINFRGLESDSFENLLRQNNHIFKFLRGEFMYLVYPAHRSKISAVDLQQRKIYHLILAMMSASDGPVPVEEVVKRLNRMFGIRLDIQALGQENDELYLRVLLKQFDLEKLEVVPGAEGAKSMLQFIVPEEDSEEDIYKEEIKCMAKTFEAILARHEQQRSRVVIVPKIEISMADFVPPGTCLNAVARTLLRRRSYFVLPELMVTPAQFFVSLEQYEDVRDEFVYDMTDRYNEWMTKKSLNSAFTVHPDHLEIGNYVAIKVEDEWTRGRILRITDNLFKIVLVDLGVYAKKVKPEELKYLHRDFSSLPELSFRCSLRHNELKRMYGEDADRSYHPYSDETLSTFYGYLRNRTLEIIPFKWHSKRETWEVKIVFLAEEETETVARKLCVTDFVKILGRAVPGNSFKTWEGRRDDISPSNVSSCATAGTSNPDSERACCSK